MGSVFIWVQIYREGQNSKSRNHVSIYQPTAKPATTIMEQRTCQTSRTIVSQFRRDFRQHFASKPVPISPGFFSLIETKTTTIRNHQLHQGTKMTNQLLHPTQKTTKNLGTKDLVVVGIGTGMVQTTKATKTIKTIKIGMEMKWMNYQTFYKG